MFKVKQVQVSKAPYFFSMAFMIASSFRIHATMNHFAGLPAGLRRLIKTLAAGLQRTAKTVASRVSSPPVSHFDQGRSHGSEALAQSSDAAITIDNMQVLAGRLKPDIQSMLGYLTPTKDSIRFASIQVKMRAY